MNSDLRRAATSVVEPPERPAPPAFSRTSTAGDSNYASDGHSAMSTTPSEVSDVSDAATAGELELERNIREKQKMLDEARREREDIERRLKELESLREEVGKKVELAGIARKVFGYITEDEKKADIARESDLSPFEIATYWDSLADDIEGLDLKVKEQLGLKEDLPPPNVPPKNDTAATTSGTNGHEAEKPADAVHEEEEERQTPPAIRRSESA